MKFDDIQLFVCPESLTSLQLKSGATEIAGEIESGVLVSKTGNEYPIQHGVPDLTYPRELAEKDEYARSFYDGRAEAYDKNLHLTFKTHREDEQKLRNIFVDALDLKPNSRVLEVSCGTGRDSEIIAERLGPEGQL